MISLFRWSLTCVNYPHTNTIVKLNVKNKSWDNNTKLISLRKSLFCVLHNILRPVTFEWINCIVRLIALEQAKVFTYRKLNMKKKGGQNTLLLVQYHQKLNVLNTKTSYGNEHRWRWRRENTGKKIATNFWPQQYSPTKLVPRDFFTLLSFAIFAFDSSAAIHSSAFKELFRIFRLCCTHYFHFRSKTAP